MRGGGVDVKFRQLETATLEGSDGSMGAGASAQARAADVQTGLARVYVKVSKEV